VESPKSEKLEVEKLWSLKERFAEINSKLFELAKDDGQHQSFNEATERTDTGRG